jgi:hypothetical protein
MLPTQSCLKKLFLAVRTTLPLPGRSVRTGSMCFDMGLFYAHTPDYSVNRINRLIVVIMPLIGCHRLGEGRRLIGCQLVAGWPLIVSNRLGENEPITSLINRLIG